MDLRLILKVIGIEDAAFVAAGGTKAVDLGEKSRAEMNSLLQVEKWLSCDEPLSK